MEGVARGCVACVSGSLGWHVSRSIVRLQSAWNAPPAQAVAMLSIRLIGELDAAGFTAGSCDATSPLSSPQVVGHIG